MAADTNQSIVPGGDGTGSKNPGKIPRKLIFVGVLVVVVAFAANIYLSKTPSPSETTDATHNTDSRSTTVSNSQNVPPPADESSNGTKSGIDLEKTDDKAFKIDFDRRLAMNNQALAKLQEELNALGNKQEQGIKKLNDDLTQRLGVLLENQTKTLDQRQHDIRYGPSAGIPGTTSGEGATPGGLPPPPGESAPVRSPIDYEVYGTAPTKDKDKPFQPFSDAAAAVRDRMSPEPLPIDKKAQAARESVKKKSIGVPSSSYAHVTLLHGVDCPIGNNLSVPVVLPIMGKIRGPNGDIVDLGAAHLQGKCVGMSNTDRGRIVVEAISYVGADSKGQFVKTEGYIVDRRDSNQDVKGFYDSKEGTALAKSALSNAIGALGQLAILSQSTQTTSAVTGGTTTVLNGGQVGAAAMGAAISGAANRTSNYYAAQLEKLVPIVHLEAGVPLDFVNTIPFEVSDAGESDEVAN
jgi:hypothetical protein